MDEFEKMEAAYAIQYPTQEADTRSNQIEVLSEAKREVLKLEEKERAAVESFASKINIVDSNQVVNYGNAAQQNLDSFTQKILDAVKGKDAGETGELIASVVTQLNSCQIDSDAKGIRKLFTRSKNYALTMKAKYDSVSESVDQVKEELERHVRTLEKDLVVYAAMFEQNKKYYKELNLYIIAGKLAIESAKEEAQRLYIEAQETGSQEKAQEYNDLMAAIDRFEKKIIDLTTTKAISLQMIPQIRMLQNTDYALIDKIRSTINNTIPLWKSQLIILLGEENSKKAIEAQRLVSDITNQMLRKNAEALHMISVETAQELERGIVDVETLRETNKQLIATLDEVSKIQREGRAKRASTEKELEKIELELKEKLLSVTPVETTKAEQQEVTIDIEQEPVVEENPFKLIL